MLRKFSAALCFTLAAALPISADEDKLEDVKASKLDIALAKYDRTGEIKNCINPRRVRSMQVIDENNIIFRVSGKKSYLNTLPRRCHNMDFYGGISYQVRGSTICSREIFHVINMSSIPGPFCSFGKFEKIVKKQKPQKTETVKSE